MRLEVKVRRQLGNVHCRQRETLEFLFEHRTAGGQVGVVRDAAEPRAHFFLRT